MLKNPMIKCWCLAGRDSFQSCLQQHCVSSSTHAWSRQFFLISNNSVTTACAALTVLGNYPTRQIHIKDDSLKKLGWLLMICFTPQPTEILQQMTCENFFFYNQKITILVTKYYKWLSSICKTPTPVNNICWSIIEHWTWLVQVWEEETVILSCLS